MNALPASLRLLFAGMLLLPLAVLARFSDSLTPEQLASTGLKRLSDTQLASVNALADRELKLAEQGGARGFAKSFCERRSHGELEATGLSALREDERAQLDSLVAERMAECTQPALQATTSPGLGVAFPKNRSALEVHGSVSFIVGSNFKGGSFYGGAFETTLSDRTGRMSLTLGYSELHGKGMPLWGAAPCEYPDNHYYPDAGNPGRLLRSTTSRSFSASLLLRGEAPDLGDN